ncbi:hypothetical protein A8F94_07090 [Bacillus sp. FJAT-27225]|uniref:DUF6157 family protein n=1 Tax=Bacillus sp. FJAT-27225 TaxID=1743144 RepID=UPI00080C2EC8|nr:DUF6157 family protein [Bacillus sp. FJAT-27225]OCA87617.1 hypothetical protein A8F94_07090 [Bacillus sp. FJAT-27225]
MCYKNTFIVKSEDCELKEAVIPGPRNGKPTIASIEYEIISSSPYQFSQEDVQFQTYAAKNQLQDSPNLEELREQFFAKSRACFRASPLVKKYGWGIHYNEDGLIALYNSGSDEYQTFLRDGIVKILKGMRSKRK